MKKIVNKVLSLFIVMLLLFSALSVAVYADDTTDYKIENSWFIRNNGMICGYSGTENNLVVPKAVCGIEAQGIEKGAFSEQSDLQSVTLPESITVIEDKAFYKCASLSEIIAPCVTKIGDSAFRGCIKLNRVFIPELQTIGKSSFRETGSLNGFPFKNLEKVPQNAFYNSAVVKVNLEKATTVQDLAFANCTSLTEVSIPEIDTENNMGYAVFENCISLEKVELKGDLLYIQPHTFDGCNFENLNCFETINIIDHDAFANNTALKDITMRTATIISDSAFENCSDLTVARFPNITYIDYFAFRNCSLLSELILSDNVEWIGNSAFDGCKNLKYLLVNGNVLIDTDAFAGSAVERLEMNGVVTVHSLPVIDNSIIALPSTFKDCTEDTIGRGYKIYGTKGTNAEKWAKENGHTFIEISQKSAILENVPEEYSGNGEILSADIIGFNLTYQWYGNTVADNTKGTPIDGATDKNFNPAEYPASPYYYCVATSTDKDCESVKIHTDITTNKAFSDNPDKSLLQTAIKRIFDYIVLLFKTLLNIA